MKFTKRIVYFSLILASVLLLQSLDFQDEEYLDIKAYTKDLCSEFGSGEGQVQLVTDDERNSAMDLVDQMSSENIREMTNKWINEQEFQTDDITKLLPYVIPWAIFLIISLFAWMFYCCYCICDKKCPPSKCCRRDFESNPYTKTELLVPVVMGVILNLMIFGSSIAGLSYAGDVGKGLRATRCAFVAVFYDIQYSSSVNKFPGLQGIYDSLSKLNTQIDTFQTDLKNTFEAKQSQAIKTSKENLVSLDYKARRGQSGSTLPVMDAGSETYLSSQKFFDYILANTSDSDFSSISSSFKSLDSQYSSGLPATPQIDLFNNYFDALIQILETLEGNYESITGGDFSSAVVSGMSSTQDIQKSVEDAATTIYDFTKPLGDYSDIVSSALYGLFGALLGFSVIALISIALLQFKKFYTLRGLLHITWSFYVLLMIIGFLLALVLHPSSVLFAEVCIYLNSYTNDEAFFQSSTLIKDQSTKDIVKTCFYTDGNVFDNLDLQTSMNNLKSVTDQITSFSDEMTKLKNGEALKVKNAMGDNYKCFTNLEDGTVIDLEPTTLQTFKSTQTSATLAAQAAKQKSNWQASTNKENDIYSQFNSTDSSFWTYLTEVDGFVTKSNDLLDSISNPSTGLLNGMNCKFLKASFERVYDGLCVVFIPAVQKTTILIIIVSISMFFGSLANCCIGLRFYRDKQCSQSTSKVGSAKKQMPDETEMEPMQKN